MLDKNMTPSSTDLLTLSIADVPVTLALAECDGETRARLTERYREFVVPTRSTISIRIRFEEGSEYLPLQIGGLLQIRTSEHNGRIEFESHYEKGWVDRRQGEGELVMRPKGNPENFLRVLYAWLCVESEGLLLHASGVVSRGRGFVFFGPSGAGKTTVARLSLDRTVLSDDLVIVKKQGAVFRLFGVPFRGDFPEAPRNNVSADLQELFALVKDGDHFTTALAPSAAAARLSACVPFVMAQPQTARRVLGICSELATSISVRELHFRKDSKFWEVIDGDR
jgi:hypothetical protein